MRKVVMGLGALAWPLAWLLAGTGCDAAGSTTVGTSPHMHSDAPVSAASEPPNGLAEATQATMPARTEPRGQPLAGGASPGPPMDGSSAAMTRPGSDPGPGPAGDAAVAPPGPGATDVGMDSDAGAILPDAAAGTDRHAGPTLPDPPASCPTLRTGMVSILGMDVRLWVGRRSAAGGGMAYLYWPTHFGMADDAESLGDNLDRIVAGGGLVAAFSQTLGAGEDTALGAWHTGDFEVADVVVACAVQQLGVDPRRIYTGGCGAGGLHAGAMVYARASYLAGAVLEGGGVMSPGKLPPGGHVPSLIASYGLTDGPMDIVAPPATRALARDLSNHGGLVIVCPGPSACIGPTSQIRDAHFRFLVDHPYGIDADPYADGLPPEFDDVCDRF